MNDAVIQLLVLAAIALFLVIRLKNVLGTRTGFEKPPAVEPSRSTDVRRDFEVIEGGPDRDITDHVEEDSANAKALAAMKLVEPGFSVTEFISGARQAYEMILMAFERGDMGAVQPFLSEDVYEAFLGVVSDREDKGLRVDASFIGVRETSLREAEFDRSDNEAQITLRFVAELTSVIRDVDGKVVEGDPNAIRKQRDVWTFARVMGSDDPNWKLVATGG
ncbi:Tim44/TimA family putative adaptor protein [Jannaschia rubra]|uniref:Mitochondrial import inner membrane, translocase subunit n=1 Tax=Jannaschia rubra TaxID=282197 RepID=A0A0M6XQC2_9RHOB|nr:Tim44/TimA family putative adaptor protein [Jannaschia rubra]CTQ32787.1 mitochondrial import inner membrane, translocase subunit [Jannaschia rubra]SFF89482.1 Predicted lipid-binding transport protein, Tim44 family [Jannaschia rubra]